MHSLSSLTLLEICGVFTVSSPKGRKETIQNRSCYGLSFCTEGQITYVHRGVPYVSRPGVAVLLPRGESYLLIGDKKGTFPVINFQCAEPLCDRHTVIPLEEEEVLLRDYEKMRALSVFEGNRAKLFSLLYNIFHRLSRPEENGPLAPALRCIRQRYGDPTLSNARLAAECRMSEGYLRKLFLRQYGTTPKQYILDLRIERAKQLLAEGSHKILSVAEQCGFSGPYHFCRAFKKQTALTPTEYMQANQTPVL